MSITVHHDEPARRYELHDGDELAALVDYRVRPDGALDLVHTETRPGFERRGLAGEVVGWALDQVRAAGGRVVPTCPFVATYIERHPEYADLVA